MTDPTSSPPFSTPFGQRLIRIVLGLLIVGVPAAFFLRACQKRRSAQEQFESEVRALHPGLLAWIEGREVKVLDVSDLPAQEHVRTFTFDKDLLKVMFSPDGARLYAVVDKGADEPEDLLVALDLETGLQTVTLDPAAAKLEKLVFDLDQMWVIPWGEAESETDRIVFRMDESDSWYSVEGKRPRVRPESGPPAKRWDQSKCPDGKHEFRKASNKSDSGLVISDGRWTIVVAGERATGEGAWWCSRK